MSSITPKQKLQLGHRILLDRDLTPVARLVGWYIVDHINTKRGYAWCPQEMIAKNLGICERAVRYAIKGVAPYFAIDRSRRQHEYRMATPANIASITPLTPANNADIEADDTGKTRHRHRQNATAIPAQDVPPSFNHPLNILREGRTHSKKGGEGRTRSKRQPRKKPSIGFPSSWQPSDTNYVHGERLGFARAEIDRAAGKFRGHHIAKGSVFANWDQAFNNWLDKDAEWNHSPRREATANGGFVGLPGSPEFGAWKTHATANSSDAKCRSLKRLLENYELSGKSFNFESEWPPGYQPTKKSNA